MEYRVIIIGAGVSGMTAAIYLKRAGVSCCVIEKKMPGGQLNYISSIENYPGNPNISGSDLAINIYKQISDLDVPIIFDEVLEIKTNDSKKIIVTNNKEIETEFIIIATGRSPKRLEIPSERNFLGKGISYCAVCDGSLYKNKEVVVIGAGASSIKESIYLSNICKKVTILNRKNEFRKGENIKSLLERDNIDILYNSEVKEFLGKDTLNEIVLKNDEKLKVDGCFIFIGFIPKTKIFNNLKITNAEGYILVDEKCETDINNVYAIGDVSKKKVFQIISCMNDAINAAFSIIEKCNNTNG